MTRKYIGIREIFGDKKVDNLLKTVLYDKGIDAIAVTNMSQAKAICSLFHTLNLTWRNGERYVKIKIKANTFPDTGNIIIEEKRTINTYALHMNESNFTRRYYFPKLGTIQRKINYPKEKAMVFPEFLKLTLKYLKQ